MPPRGGVHHPVHSLAAGVCGLIPGPARSLRRRTASTNVTMSTHARLWTIYPKVPSGDGPNVSGELHKFVGPPTRLTSLWVGLEKQQTTIFQ